MESTRRVVILGSAAVAGAAGATTGMTRALRPPAPTPDLLAHGRAAMAAGGNR